MIITSKYSIHDNITQWTLEKIKSNPELFGGDNGNNEIILAYIKETNPFSFVSSLTTTTIAHSVAVSRARNKMLKDYPEFDFRIKNKPKKK